MSEKTLWTGYYRLIYDDNLNTHHFGYLLAFALNRDDFQQKIYAYNRQHQCRLTSQLAPLPAAMWFERHGYQAVIWQHAQQLDENDMVFLSTQEKAQMIEGQNYLSQQQITISSPLPDVFHYSGSLLYQTYLPDVLSGKGFFEQLNMIDNPKEGLFRPNPAFIPSPEVFRYYAVVDGVKSIVLPQLFHHEGRMDSLYKGELKRTMDNDAPFLAQLTVTDRGTSPSVNLLFAQAEQPWFGLWDLNPAIFIRTKRSFDEVHYHLRKFVHLYNENTEEWYFFRFYEPAVLVSYLQYIATEPSRLASFFGFRNGEAVIESFAARVGNEFYVFALKDLPTDTQPSAVSYDEYLQGFLDDFDRNKLLNDIISQEIPAEFPEHTFSPHELKNYLKNAFDLGFRMEGSLINLVKAQCYLAGDMEKLKSYWINIVKEYDESLSESEIGELLYEKIKHAIKFQG